MKKKHIILILIILILIGLLGFGKYKELTYSEEELSLDSFKEEEIPIEEETPIEEPKVSNINLLAVGDIMFHSPQIRAAYDTEKLSYDFNFTFRHIKKYVEAADIALANFETVTAGEEIRFQGFPRFNTPKESLGAIKGSGFNILSTANNHSIDQGKKGLISTIDAIGEYGLKNIGTYKEPNTPILVEDIEGIKIGFLSYTYGLNGLNSLLTEEELSFMVNLIDEEKIQKDIEETKDLEVDLTVVFIHWGNEYQREPSEYQIELGEKMVDWGANIILGSHPHVIQKSQIINIEGRDNFIIYSMGNFLSNQRKETLNNSYTEDGLMVNLGIEKDFTSGETIIKDITYIPTWVHRYRDNGKLLYEILPINDYLNEVDDIALGLKTRLEKSFNDTMGKMAQD